MYVLHVCLFPQGKADEELKPIVPPPLTGPTEFTKSGMDALKGYETTWLDRDETENFAQKHDEDLTKDVIRPNVAEEIRKQVDLMLEDQLANFKKQLAAGGKGKKGKGKKKGKKKGKGGKGKKVKALPGAKACAGMDVDHMLSVLVENKIVNNVRSKSISDLKGSFNYIGSAYQVCDGVDSRETVVVMVIVRVSFHCICRPVTRRHNARPRSQAGTHGGSHKTRPLLKSGRT